MIWFFAREHDRLHYEIRRQADGHDYELVITYPDGSQLVERFEDAMGLLARQDLLQSELFERGWRALERDLKHASFDDAD